MKCFAISVVTSPRILTGARLIISFVRNEGRIGNLEERKYMNDVEAEADFRQLVDRAFK